MADLRSVLNGGYRRGAKVYRCTTNGKKVGVEALDAFCAVAVAGLKELPNTIASRAIIIRMKRRAPDEGVTPFRHRYHGPEAKPIRETLEDWCEEHEENLIGAEPEMRPALRTVMRTPGSLCSLLLTRPETIGRSGLETPLSI